MDLDSAALTSTSASASASRSPATPSPEPEMNNSIFNDVPPASSGIAADDEEDGMDDTDEEETVLVDEREVTGKGKGKREPEVRASGKKMVSQLLSDGSELTISLARTPRVGRRARNRTCTRATLWRGGTGVRPVRRRQ